MGCQAANPLGKSLGMLDSDMASMSRELERWKQDSVQAEEAFTKAAAESETMLRSGGWYRRLAETEERIFDEQEKVRGAKARILRNDQIIMGLLESVLQRAE